MLMVTVLSAITERTSRPGNRVARTSARVNRPRLRSGSAINSIASTNAIGTNTAR